MNCLVSVSIIFTGDGDERRQTTFRRSTTRAPSSDIPRPSGAIVTERQNVPRRVNARSRREAIGWKLRAASEEQGDGDGRVAAGQLRRTGPSLTTTDGCLYDGSGCELYTIDSTINEQP
ncbi:unnamed protein product [Soboliphyme baturini]|uniref:Uncharacterized protein n=1 Tax=Soboliphyme baturini TaxID=241478 RepID=A0A183ISW7_9BILA|nr:unnamed protein product [Soboliphyme baturini]